MPEYLVVEEPFLKVGMYVHFSEGWKVEFADKVFEVLVVQQIYRAVWRIVGTASPLNVNDIDLEAEGYYPDSPKTLFEILFKFKGENCVLYPRLPSTDYYNKLEKSGYMPDPTSNDKRYLGGYTEKDLEKRLLREYALKKDYMETIIYRVYNDSTEAEHVVLDGMINRCRLSEIVDAEKKRKILESGRYREIQHWSVIKW